jgi:pyruvate/2-oxoglutarate dehydrogenase complex dihydrolipoamide dehydrogenase (E3) component
VGKTVVILGAGAQACDIAVYLLGQGVKVIMVQEGLKKDIDKEQSMWVRTYFKPMLYSQGVKIWNQAKVNRLTADGLEITTATGTTELIPCDTVIESYDMVANTSLFDAVKGKYEAYAVGDCDKPWNISDAILNGNLAARKI